tara:strand:- start:7 stop:231 length:225 start_codon:yes stop_codon:yes gene_type:complete
MPVSDEDRAEATRLVELDERGREIEAVAIILSTRRQADESAAELEALDRGWVDEIAGSFRSRSGSTFDGPEFIS